MGKPSMSYVMLSICEYIAYLKVDAENWNILVPAGRERKSIPWVAASETGRAQTNELACWGCRTLYTELQKNKLDESSGKMNQRR